MLFRRRNVLPTWHLFTVVFGHLLERSGPIWSNLRYLQGTADPGTDVPGVAPLQRGASGLVLVVDDNEDAAMMLSTLLELHGYRTSVAHDGPAAIAAAESLRPAMILLDIGLPGLNGFDVCQRVREQSWGKDIVVIALTGWGQESDRHRSREAGFHHHLVKPVEHEVLLSLLASARPASTAS